MVRAAVTTIASSPRATSAGAASCAKAGEESAVQASAAKAHLRFMITPVSKRALVRHILTRKGFCAGGSGQELTYLSSSRRRLGSHPPRMTHGRGHGLRLDAAHGR